MQKNRDQFSPFAKDEKVSKSLPDAPVRQNARKVNNSHEVVL